MTPLRWSNEYIDSIPEISHFTVRDDQIVDLCPTAIIHKPMPQEQPNEGILIFQLFFAMVWSANCYALCYNLPAVKQKHRARLLLFLLGLVGSPVL